MSKKPKALLIVEGGKDEKAFFMQYEKINHLDFEIYCFKANIYALFSDLKKYDFNADIKKVLELRNPNKKTTLSQTFAYIYLVFDLDAHHPKTNDKRSLNEIFESNIIKAHEMAKFFTDETDPTKGRLYINYPMFESLRACDSFEDINYKSEIVTLEEAARFKNYVAPKKLSSIHFNKYTEENFSSLIRLNLFKLSQLAFGKWAPLDYNEYLMCSTTDTVLSLEEKFILKGHMPVLCTSLFIAVDYYGNKKNWYDKVVQAHCINMDTNSDCLF